MDENNTRILVVDDEEDLCEILQYNLESQGYIVSVANSAEEAMKLDISNFNLVLLDVMMEGMSGFKLADRLRKEMKISTPIIFLTARDTENDLLTGFNIGADDYITKPFSINEMSARVKAVVKRSMASQPEQHKADVYGNISIDNNSKIIIINGTKIDLPKKEFEIFGLLFAHPGKVFTREEILYRVWTDDVIVGERTVDVNITRLRKKLEPNNVRILNKPGYGYYLEVKE